MFQRLIRNDLKENKISMLVIGLFLLLTLTLSFAATRLTVRLTSSIERFVETAKSPHLLQMHSGSVDRERLKNFVQQHPEIASWQLTDFVNVEGSAIRINEKDSLQDSSQDNGFSSQNQNFDFLLDQNNQPAQPQLGQVYIPLYYYNSGKIKIGDKISVGSLQLTVKGFIRDAQMNAGLVSSKRFLISQADLQTLKKEAFASNENLIAFRVHKLSQISSIEQAYKNAELESNGPPMITYPTIKMINGFNDALVILVMGLLVVAIIGITFLCMRFSLLTKIQEELQQIAVMKIMGLPQSFISRVYLTKYYFCLALATIIGWGLSFLLSSPFKKQMVLSMGQSPTPFYSYLLEMLVALLLCLLVFWLTARPLSSFKKMTPGQALRLASSNSLTETRSTPKMGLPTIPFSDRPYFALKTILSHKKLYLTILFIVSLISLLILLPASLYSTVMDKNFIQYVGAGQADVLIDISQTEDIDTKASQLLKELQADKDIAEINQYQSQNFSYQDQQGQTQQLRVTLGNHAGFPVKYSQGRYPKNEDEIALSKLQAEELKLKVGDNLTLNIDGQARRLKIVGIYSDLTYGGKTAKAVFVTKQAQTLNSLTTIRLKDASNKAKKINDWKKHYSNYKLTDIEDFFHQTFDDTLAMLRLIQTSVFRTGLIIVFILMTLFVYMIFTKDQADLALYRMLGFGSERLRSHYLLAVCFILMLALAIADLLLLSLGQEVCSLLLSSFGISKLQLIINKSLTFLWTPLALLLSGLTAAHISLRALNKLEIGRYLKEH
ncbi:FtsX-like permease family protein [Streptococcus sp. IsoGale022]|uniref:FtsX-like permease family protein n=1 Tax=Streptococcus sp. IsoGale022 TaxID=2923524 RepID=UPI00280D2D2B|nr:FtsX-like permease family protein [Streptococcus sp. IsoGale022]MDQ8692891.1 FtsX-like permease family protein [Streptococcus sp. IsoGale022]